PASSLSEHTHPAHVNLPAAVQVIENESHIVDCAAERFLQLADEPLLHGTIVDAGAGESWNKSHRRDSACRYPLGPAVIPEARVFAVIEVKHDWRLGHSLGKKDPQ